MLRWAAFDDLEIFVQGAPIPLTEENVQITHSDVFNNHYHMSYLLTLGRNSSISVVIKCSNVTIVERVFLVEVPVEVEGVFLIDDAPLYRDPLFLICTLVIVLIVFTVCAFVLFKYVI